MSDEHVRKRTRRKRRRHHKKLRSLLGTLGLASMGIGVLICGLAVLKMRGVLLGIGACYLVAGGVVLLIKAGLGRSAGRIVPEARDGMALILSLLLVAVLGVLVMYSLGGSHVALRSAHDRTLRVAAQTVAVDAAWNTLADVARGAVRVGQTVLWRPPEGLHARVRVSTDPRARAHGGTLLIHSVAETNQVRYEVYCVARRQANGAVTPTRWIEP